MKLRLLFPSLLALAIAGTATAETPKPLKSQASATTGKQAEVQEPSFLENRYVVILSVYEKFSAAREDAEKIAKETRVPFSMEGRVFDKKRGLIYPDNLDDELFRGQYVARRYHRMVLKKTNEERAYLSVERSDGYDGFKKGFYIVVAGIHGNAAEAQAQVKAFAKWAPSAYAKKTRIYMGCMH